jgi:hypothetical protein
MYDEANACRMQACDASIAGQWNREIAPMRSLKYVRGGHQPYATALAHQSRGGQRLQPALIQARQGHCSF